MKFIGNFQDRLGVKAYTPMERRQEVPGLLLHFPCT